MQTTKYISSGRNALADEDFLDEAVNTNNPFPKRDSAKELRLEGRTIPCSRMVIFSDDLSGAICIATIGVTQATKIAEIKADDIVVSEIYANDSNEESVIVKNKELVPEKLVYQWLDIVFTFSPKSVVLLGAVRRYFLVTRCSSNALKYLATTSAESKTSLLPGDVVALEPGNIVTGDIAAVLSYCEVRNIEAVAVLVVRDAAMSVSTMRSFEKLIPFLGSQIGCVIKKPSSTTYSELVKRDSFLSATENIYT